MPRLTVDPELLFVALLTTDAPDGVFVTSSADVDALENLPMVIIDPVLGQMISNGSPGLGWQWTVQFSVLGLGHQAMSDLADEVYQIVHRWHDEQAAIVGVGYINHTTDVSMFNRTATVVGVGHLTQYTGTFQFNVRPDN